MKREQTSPSWTDLGKQKRRRYGEALLDPRKRYVDVSTILLAAGKTINLGQCKMRKNQGYGSLGVQNAGPAVWLVTSLL